MASAEAQRHHLWLSGGLAAIAIHSLVSFPLHLPATATAVVLFLGMTTAEPGDKRSMKGWIPISLGAILVGFVLWVFAADMAISNGTNEFAKGNLPLAQAELERGVSRSPWPGEGYTYLGLTEFALGRPEAAMEALELGLVDGIGSAGYVAREIVGAEEIIDEARNGRMFILVDDEDRENEGDLVIPAQMATPEAINFMATHGRGLICLTLTGERIDALRRITS